MGTNSGKNARKPSGTSDRDIGRETPQSAHEDTAHGLFSEEVLEDDQDTIDFEGEPEPWRYHEDPFPRGITDFVDADPPSQGTDAPESMALAELVDEFGGAGEVLEVEMFVPVIDRNMFRPPPPGPMSLAEYARYEAGEYLRLVDEMDAPHLEARERADPAPVWVENNQWAGSIEMFPPFSVGEFEAAYPRGVSTRSGYNAPRVMRIPGDAANEWTVVRLDHIDNVDPGSYQVTEKDMFATVENPTRYQSSADVATYRMAQEVGLGDHVPETYAFFYQGHYHVAYRYDGNCEVLTGALRVNPENGHIANPRQIPSDNLAELAIFEYLLQKANWDPDDYLLHINEHEQLDRLIIRERGDTLRFQGTFEQQGSWAARLYEAKYGVNGAILSKPVIKSFLGHEQEMLSIARHYRVDAGMPGLTGRFGRLRTLSEQPGEITVGDLGLEPIDPDRW